MQSSVSSLSLFHASSTSCLRSCLVSSQFRRSSALERAPRWDINLVGKHGFSQISKRLIFLCFSYLAVRRFPVRLAKCRIRNIFHVLNDDHAGKKIMLLILTICQIWKSSFFVSRFLGLSAEESWTKISAASLKRGGVNWTTWKLWRKYIFKKSKKVFKHSKFKKSLTTIVYTIQEQTLFKDLRKPSFLVNT